MRDSVIFSAEGRINTKKERAKDCRKSSYASTVPSSYKNNSTWEELCLQYIQSFLKQYEILYPKRKQPYMIVDNEHGVQKFVCSVIRPSHIPFSELYDMYECSAFLAGYILYEPLDPPTRPPHLIFSPTETLKLHTGDCFDISTLLCSLLIGSGYDAYVVCGYAPRHITLRDQSSTPCPMATSLSDSFAKTKIKNEEEEKSEIEESSYIPLDNSVKSSQYIERQEERKRVEKLDTFELWITDPPPITSNGEKDIDSDLCDGERRQHAWVMVCAGRRDVKENVFFEPSTGRVYSSSCSPYLGVDSVWNNNNYWVLNSTDQKVQDINFDLSKTDQWESLFPNGTQTSEDDETSAVTLGDDNDDMMEEKKKDRPNKSTHSKNISEVLTDVSRSFENPPSWVSPITLDRSLYLLRYPPYGRRTIQYYCAKADFFARNTHPQCMVMRVMTYLDKDRTIVKEINEWFENRKDKMYKRVRTFLGPNNRFVEFYNPGGSGEVKQWTNYPGKRAEIDFYVDGRLDRLVRRVEIVGEKVFEIFQGRTDCLIYRSVLFTVDKMSVGARQFPLPGGGLANELYVLRMTLKYEVDKSQSVMGTDVAKRVFFVKEGKVVATYHFELDQVTCNVKTYLHSRGPGVQGMTEQAYAQETGVVEGQEALQEAAQLERECYSGIKSSFLQMQRIYQSREESEKNVINEKNVFEVALDRADKLEFQHIGSAEGKEEKEAKGLNYLTPYLRLVKDPSKITRDEATDARQNCLDALRARLVERANIIQSRLNDENAKLGREQERFQRSQREGDLSTEEYEKYCTEAMFRIQILEQRLATHEEAALRKFSELDAKLSSDERLMVLRPL